jgi:hypothetical protein
VLGWGVYYNYASPVLTEVDAQGHVLFQFSFTDEERWSYRAIKVPPGAFDLDALRNAVGKSPPPT